MTPVRSSQVKSLGYDRATQEIFVEYRNCIWSYPCDELEHQELMETINRGGSVGIYVNVIFKPKGGKKVYS